MELFSLLYILLWIAHRPDSSLTEFGCSPKSTELLIATIALLHDFKVVHSFWACILENFSEVYFILFISILQQHLQHRAISIVAQNTSLKPSREPPDSNRTFVNKCTNKCAVRVWRFETSRNVPKVQAVTIHPIFPLPQPHHNICTFEKKNLF